MTYSSWRTDPQQTASMQQTNVSEHSRGVALALSAVTGVFGGHRFYVGKVGTGLLMLGTFGGLGIWYIYDLILVAAGAFKDSQGRRVADWGVSETGSRAPRLTGERVELLFEELDGLHSEMSELQERLDFMERMVTSIKDRERLPPTSSSL